MTIYTQEYNSGINIMSIIDTLVLFKAWPTGANTCQESMGIKQIYPSGWIYFKYSAKFRLNLPPNLYLSTYRLVQPSQITGTFFFVQYTVLNMESHNLFKVQRMSLECTSRNGTPISHFVTQGFQAIGREPYEFKLPFHKGCISDIMYIRHLYYVLQN